MLPDKLALTNLPEPQRHKMRAISNGETHASCFTMVFGPMVLARGFVFKELLCDPPTHPDFNITEG